MSDQSRAVSLLRAGLDLEQIASLLDTDDATILAVMQGTGSLPATGGGGSGFTVGALDSPTATLGVSTQAGDPTKAAFIIVNFSVTLDATQSSANEVDIQVDKATYVVGSFSVDNEGSATAAYFQSISFILAPGESYTVNNGAGVAPSLSIVERALS